MSYTRPDYNAADATWVGAAAYTRPAHDAADASFLVSYAATLAATLGDDQAAIVAAHVPPVAIELSAALADDTSVIAASATPYVITLAATLAGVSATLAGIVRTQARQAHQAAWRVRLEATLSAVWSIPLRPPVHALAWGDLTVSRSSRVHPWEDRATPRAGHEAAWADQPAVRLDHTLAWSDQAASRAGLTSRWADQAAVRGALVSPWADAASSRQAVVAAWGDQVAALGEMTSPWADATPASGELLAAWGAAIPTRQAHGAAWADLPISRRTHQAAWADCSASRATHAAVYADQAAARAALTAPWAGQLETRPSHTATWSLTAVARQSHGAAWALAARPAARASLTGRWALLADLSLLSISNVPTVRWRDQTLAIHGARLSLDEDSPVWLAEEIELADLTAWGAIALGDELEFIVQEETWRLRVDGKGLTRPAPGALRLTLSAVSPLAWLDAPYAAAITLDNTEGPVSAQATVAGLLAAVGTLRWELDDWLIPAGALAMSDTTPVQAAREIVAAIGGVLESDPDGTPVARRRHPVAVPDYAAATPAHVIEDADLFSFQVAAAPLTGFNRLLVSNEDLRGDEARDALEYRDEDDNKYDGEMRAWPNPWRPVTLGHTGHPDTQIEPLGEQTYTQTELVEFIAGQGRVEYPVQAITAVTWQHVDLGAVSAQGSDLTATTPGQSLALVTYTSRALAWRVGLDRDEAVQFVLI